MKRPRIKCARCGKRRVPPYGVSSVRWLAGRKLQLNVQWTVTRPICNICNNEIAN